MKCKTCKNETSKTMDGNCEKCAEGVPPRKFYSSEIRESNRDRRRISASVLISTNINS